MLNWIAWNRTVYMYKLALALNNQQWLIYHKTKTTCQTLPGGRRFSKPSEIFWIIWHCDQLRLYFCDTMLGIRGVGVGKCQSEDSFVCFGAKPTQRACARDFPRDRKRTKEEGPRVNRSGQNRRVDRTGQSTEVGGSRQSREEGRTEKSTEQGSQQERAGDCKDLWTQMPG